MQVEVVALQQFVQELARTIATSSIHNLQCAHISIPRCASAFLLNKKAEVSVDMAAVKLALSWRYLALVFFVIAMS